MLFQYSKISKKNKRKSKIEIELFFFKKNYYYWPAIERVISIVFNKHKYPEWILACNNDIIVDDTNFLNRLFKKNNKVQTVIGPNILNSNNIRLNPFLVHPMSARKILFWNIYFKSYYLSLIINSLRNIFHIDKRKKKKCGQIIPSICSSWFRNNFF